jgi:hypothetical protein
MIQEFDTVYGVNAPTTRWWRLSPDNTGSYTSGSWSRLADSNVVRKYFASAVLADGRVVICGGEYTVSNGVPQETETNACEMYDPVTNSWTVFNGPSAGSPPALWSNVGDSPCAVLPDGSFLLGSFTNADVAKLDPAMMTWTALNQRPSSSSAEESWVLMPDNTIGAPSNISPGVTWVYNIANDQWNQDNNLPNNIIEAVPGDVGEIGTGLLRYDGTAFFVGGNQNTGIYSAGAATHWTNGPNIPPVSGQNQGVMDGSGAILVNGNILVGVARSTPKAASSRPAPILNTTGPRSTRQATHQTTTVQPTRQGCYCCRTAMYSSAVKTIPPSTPTGPTTLSRKTVSNR